MAATEFRFEAIGTHWKIIIPEELIPSVCSSLEKKILERISLYDKAYSRFREDSLVLEMSRKSGTFELPSDAPLLFDLYEKVYALTGGKVTPFIGSVMEEAGYDRTYSLQPKTLHNPPSWEKTLARRGQLFTMKQPALIDIGAAGKGYIIDLVSDLIKGEGYASYLIDAGGDIIHRSEENIPLRIGLENPNDITSVIGVITLENESICGSAGNRRSWGRYHHIIDPITLESPQDILATWVVAETTLLADMLATCLFFVPANMLAEHFSFSYVVLAKDFSVEYSPGMNAEFY